MKLQLSNQTLDLSKPINQENFVFDTHNASELLRKELDINHAEQEILGQRIRMMKTSINDLPSFDPQYSLLSTQIKMDQIELDEAKGREYELADQLNKLPPQPAKENQIEGTNEN